MDIDPLELISTPKLSRKLPDVLTVDDIEKIISSVDMCKNEGVRNRAILEVLYSCGLRVSELINLQMSRLDMIDSLVSVIGKGNKERVVPIGSQAFEAIVSYLEHYESQLNINEGHEGYLIPWEVWPWLNSPNDFHNTQKRSNNCRHKKEDKPSYF